MLGTAVLMRIISFSPKSEIWFIGPLSHRLCSCGRQRRLVVIIVLQHRVFFSGNFRPIHSQRLQMAIKQLELEVFFVKSLAAWLDFLASAPIMASHQHRLSSSVFSNSVQLALVKSYFLGASDESGNRFDRPFIRAKDAIWHFLLESTCCYWINYKERRSWRWGNLFPISPLSPRNPLNQISSSRFVGCCPWSGNNEVHWRRNDTLIKRLLRNEPLSQLDESLCGVISF